MMAVLKSRAGLRLDANFSEDAVGFAIEAFLTLLSFPNSRFSIEPFTRAKERRLGADARLDGHRIRGFRPFYMQFKRPAAYPDFSNAGIVRDRKKLSLSVTPRSLFFPLRAKSAQHHDYQHNILHRLRQRLIKYQLGDAAYICPLFLDRSAYRFHIHWAGLSHWARFWRHYPWELENVLVNHSNGNVLFERIPILAEHVSIPPHNIVSDARHSYSFDEAGRDLCFHSPIALPEGASTLAAFLNDTGRGFLGERRKVTPNTAFQDLMNLAGAVDTEQVLLRETPEFSPDDPIGNWLSWGDMLLSNYAIEQFAFVRWEDS